MDIQTQEMGYQIKNVTLENYLKASAFYKVKYHIQQIVSTLVNSLKLTSLINIEIRTLKVVAQNFLINFYSKSINNGCQNIIQKFG